MAGSIVAFRDENIVIPSAFQRLVERYWCAHEFLLNLSEPVNSRLQLEVVVARALRDSGDDSDVVAFWTNVVR